MRRLADSNAALFAAIHEGGYHPVVVSEGVREALAEESAIAFVVHHEPTFDRDEVRRHMTVLVLTETRIVVLHTDEHPPDDVVARPYTSTTSESVPVEEVRSVVVTRMVAEDDSEAAEAVLTVGWGAVARIDLEPARCPDPSCDADHGYTGSVSSDDLTLRLSAAADGPEAVARLLDFGRRLNLLTTRR